MSRRAPIAALLAAALACVGLSGCRTNVGMAARVNGETISESQVSSYLTGRGPSDDLKRRASQANQDVTAARVVVLRNEIDRRLYERTLRANGGIPSGNRLDDYRDRALSVLLQENPSTSNSELGSRLDEIGVKPSYIGRYLRVLELEVVIILRLQLTERTQLTAALRKAGAKVTVNPRYGKWNASQLVLDSSGDAGLPPFLKLQKNLTPQANATNGGAG